MGKPMRIQRVTEAELDLAIKDLEKRGYTLLERGKAGYTVTETKFHGSALKPFKYAGTNYHGQHFAVLKKEGTT